MASTPMNDDETTRLLGTVGPAELARLLNEIDGQTIGWLEPKQASVLREASEYPA